jgi:hypothetical protein
VHWINKEGLVQVNVPRVDVTNVRDLDANDGTTNDGLFEAVVVKFKLKRVFVLVAAALTRLETKTTADFWEKQNEGRMIGLNDRHATPERHRRK